MSEVNKAGNRDQDIPKTPRPLSKALNPLKVLLLKLAKCNNYPQNKERTGVEPTSKEQIIS